MSSREEILADFQACTGIEDVEIAICHLEATNWSLVEAVNRAMNDSISSPHSAMAGGPLDEPMPPAPINILSNVESLPQSMSIPPPLVDMTSRITASMRGASGVSLSDDFFPVASSSTQRTRMLDFNIQFNDRMIHLKVPDHEDIRTLKTLIQGETGIPPCKQDLGGFNRINAPFPITDRRRLSEMNLPKENFLYLTAERDWKDINGEAEAAATGPSDEDPPDFKLTITDERTNRTYTLNYPPTKTILNIKMDVSDFTSIAVSKQKWTGWPDNISDELSLAQIGIPKHHLLTVNSNSPTSTPTVASPSMPILDFGEDTAENPDVPRQDSESDFEEINPDVTMDDDDDDDDLFLGAVRPSGTQNGRLQPLLPDDFGDETMAAIRFGEEFESRYGNPHPHFFPGSLDQAIKESCMQPAKDRKMLAVYFHHDSSVLTNVFCTQALCTESVSNFLNENFVSFGWDLTFHSNKSRAVEMITRHFGSVAALTIKNFEVEKLPILALVYRLRGTTEIYQIIHGNVTLDELMSRLLSAYEAYHSQLLTEIKEDDERIARDAVKREQDLAFEMSLVADREKEAQKLRDVEAKQIQERLENEERLQAERMKVEAEKERERKRTLIRQRLPPEPEKTDSRKMSRLRFRIPVKGDEMDSTDEDGGNDRQWLERRFLASHSLRVVFDYLTVEGYPNDEYKVLSSWPRRDLTQLDPEKTLEELKLCPQETLTLEEK